MQSILEQMVKTLQEANAHPSTEEHEQYTILDCRPGQQLADPSRLATMMTDWPLQDAKNRLSAVVDAALAGDPQRVTRRGKPAVVVLAVDEYERLRRIEQANAPTLAELLLEIPQDGQEFERLSLPVRTPNL